MKKFICLSLFVIASISLSYGQNKKLINKRAPVKKIAPVSKVQTSKMKSTKKYTAATASDSLFFQNITEEICGYFSSKLEKTPSNVIDFKIFCANHTQQEQDAELERLSKTFTEEQYEIFDTEFAKLARFEDECSEFISGLEKKYSEVRPTHLTHDQIDDIFSYYMKSEKCEEFRKFTNVPENK
jgi:hypothetical protein